MREVILTMSISLDGFVAGAEGDSPWIFNGDGEAIAWKVEHLENAGLHIMGSRVFRSMAAYWPTATTPFARPMNRIPKAVFSRRAAAVPASASDGGKPDGTSTGQWQPGAESWTEAYVASGDLAQEIAKLKAVDGKPIVAHGGAAFARSLIAENLVDQYALMVYPIALGKGLSIFSDLSAPRSLQLVSSKAFPLGTVAQVYRTG